MYGDALRRRNKELGTPTALDLETPYSHRATVTKLLGGHSAPFPKQPLQRRGLDLLGENVWSTPLGSKWELGLRSLGLPRRIWRIGSSEHPQCASMEGAQRNQKSLCSSRAPCFIAGRYIRRKQRWHRVNHTTPWAGYGMSLSLDPRLRNGDNDYLR